MTSTRNTRVAALAGIAVALVAAGGAYAASKLHHGGSAGGYGDRGGFMAPSGYGFRGGGGFGGPPGAFRGRHHGPADVFATVTSYLGISAQQLFTQLRSGKTLAQIADATDGKSASGLIDALVAAEQKRRPGESAAAIRTRVTAFVNGTGFHRFGDGGRPFPPGQEPSQGKPTQGTHI